MTPLSIPSGWRRVRIDSVGTVVTGSTPPTRERSYYGRDRMFVSPADLGRNKYVSSTVKMLSMRGFSRSRRVPVGSTLFVCIGSTIGKVGIASADLATNQQINAIIPNNRVDSEYLYYAATTLSDHVREQAGEQAVPLVNKSDFSAFEILFPPIGEQREIASVLADADELISAFERLIAKKQAIKQGMMQQLLTGRIRLPGFSATWDETGLGDVIGTLEAGVSVNSVSSPGPYAVLKTSSVSNGKFLPQESKTIAHRDLSRARLNPLANSLIISRMNTPALVGEVGYIAADWPNLYLPDRLWLARPRPGASFDMRWLGYVLSSSDYSTRLKELATGTSGSMKNIAKDSLLNVRIPRPSYEEQKAIAAALGDADAEVDVLHLRLRKARDTKQGMTQELLTGRTRLPVQGAAS
jgi:type I restriction enzyme S subunit